MGIRERQALIAQIEELRGSRLITLVTAQRPPAVAGLGRDVGPVLHGLARDLEHEKRKKLLDVFLICRAGDAQAAIEAADILRQSCDELTVLLTDRTANAGAVLALSADRIIFGGGGVLQTPVQATQFPTSAQQGSFPMPVEPKALAATADAGRTTGEGGGTSPVGAGLIRRALAASSRGTKSPLRQELIATMFGSSSRPQVVAFDGARDLGLPVAAAEPELDALLLQLRREYVAMLHFDAPIAHPGSLGDDDEVTIHDFHVAAMETTAALQMYGVTLRLEQRRAVPPDAKINVELKLGGTNGQLSAETVRRLRAQVGITAREQLRRQSPLVAIDTWIYSGRWHTKNYQDDIPAPAEPTAAG